MRWYLAVLVLCVWAMGAGAITPDGQGQVLWCDAQHNLWGYTLRDYPSDNIMYFNYLSNPLYLGYNPWVNGYYVSIAALEFYSFAGTFDSEFDPYTDAFLSEHLDTSTSVTFNSPSHSIITCCAIFSDVEAIERGPNGTNPAAYPNGQSGIAFGAVAYQAGQLAPRGPWNFGPPTQPPLPAQDISTMVSHLGQVSDSPQPATNGFNWTMKNKGLVELKINGQPGQVPVAVDAPFTVTAEVHPGACLGQAVEYWVASINRNPGGHVWWRYPNGTWVKQDAPISSGIAALRDVAPVSIDQGPLAPGYAGIWDWYVCADFGAANGVISNPLICATVRAIIQ